MPLMRGKSKEAFEKNVKTEIDAGKPQDQSLAIAYSLKRRSKKAEGGQMHQEGCTCSKCSGGMMAEGGTAAKTGYDHSDPSLESETPDVEYVAGTPQYKDRQIVHPLSYQNAKAQESNETEAKANNHAKGGEAMNDKPMKTKRQRAMEAFYAQGGPVMTDSGYQSTKKVDTKPDLAYHEEDNLSQSHQSTTPKSDPAARAEDDRRLNQHGDVEEGPQGTWMADGGQITDNYADTEDGDGTEMAKMAEGGQITDNYADTEDGDGLDMVGKIMKMRQQTFSKGGKVANEDHGHDENDLAGFDTNEFDDLALRDDLSSSYTGANSGDETSDARENKDRRDMVSMIMKNRKMRGSSQTIPAPMRKGM